MKKKTGQGFVRFIETRMKTPESIAEKLQRKDYDVDFDTAVTALNDISRSAVSATVSRKSYWIARQIGKNRHIYHSKGKITFETKRKKARVTISFWISDVLQRKDNCGSCGIAAADDDHGCVGNG